MNSFEHSKPPLLLAIKYDMNSAVKIICENETYFKSTMAKKLYPINHVSPLIAAIIKKNDSITKLIFKASLLWDSNLQVVVCNENTSSSYTDVPEIITGIPYLEHNELMYWVSSLNPAKKAFPVGSGDINRQQTLEFATPVRAAITANNVYFIQQWGEERLSISCEDLMMAIKKNRGEIVACILKDNPTIKTTPEMLKTATNLGHELVYQQLLSHVPLEESRNDLPQEQNTRGPGFFESRHRDPLQNSIEAATKSTSSLTNDYQPTNEIVYG